MAAGRLGLPVRGWLALIGLTRTLLRLRPALQAGVPLPSPAAQPELVNRILGWLGLPELVAHPVRVPASLERAVREVGERAAHPDLAGPLPDAAVEATVRTVLAESVAGWLHPVPVQSPDGIRLRSYVHGADGAPPVLLASACGMPAELCEPWLRALSRTRRVITWETRGLFGTLDDPATFDAGTFDAVAHDPAAQAADLIAVLDEHGVRQAHLAGLCGGAVVALAAAGSYPDRVSSLSLWHGDYELGALAAKTAHQQNLQALLQLAEAGRPDAAAINEALRSVALSGVGEQLGLIGYPYLDDELFYRYCLLTGALMAADVAALLPAVTQPTLVITSDDDQTAHPAGSHVVAGRLAGGRLHVEPHGDHLSVFGASDRLRRVLEDFLDGLADEVAA